MNRALFKVSLVCLAMFLLLMANVNYVQAFESSSLATKSGNARVFYQQLQFQRGSIIAGNNVAVAESCPVRSSARLTRTKCTKPAPGVSSTYQRYYPDGPAYAPVTGYDSVYGKTGIEGVENKQLSGTAPQLAVQNLIGLFTGKAKQGASVYLTISPKAQQAAYSSLAALGRPGAVVALDPSTGAVLAMASYPTFNPNLYTTFDGSKLVRIDNRLRADKSQPLLNRAINATYPPGSTFKIVTSATGFSTHAVQNEQSTVPAPPNFKLPGSTTVLINNDGESCLNGNPPLIDAFALSCNTAFGKLGIKVGGPALHRNATRFGMNNSGLTIPLPVSASVVPSEKDPDYAALTAIGQFDDNVTPLQEAMMSAAVANNGKLMRPYLVQQVRAPDLQVTQQPQPQPLSRPMTPRVAGYLQKMMTAVVQSPSGTAYAENKSAIGVEIAGKTGTAQNGINNTNLDDAVFTCYGPTTNPKIAVGVIIQGGGYGAAAAAPIAVKVIQAYLGIK